MAKRVLIIDDDPDAVDFVACVLKDHGYESVQSLSSVQALETARSEKPDLILLDLFMPEKSGITLFKELKEDPDLAHIPVVVVSGMPQTTGTDVRTFIGKQIERSHEGFSAGSKTPVGVVDKPIDPERLIAIIRKNINEGDG